MSSNKTILCDKCNAEYNPRTAGSCPVCKIKEKKEDRTIGLRLGHFKALVTHKKEENERLKETRDFLADNVKSLWKMVRLLEWRKNELAEYIVSMENYLKKGSDIVDTFHFEPSEEMPLTEE